MKITKQRLKRIIQEELQNIQEQTAALPRQGGTTGIPGGAGPGTEPWTSDGIQMAKDLLSHTDNHSGFALWFLEEAGGDADYGTEDPTEWARRQQEGPPEKPPSVDEWDV